MTAERRFPAPPVTPEGEAFWTAAAAGRFLLRWCIACGRAHWYPRATCPFCASDRTEWRDASGRGTIYSFSTLRRASPPFTIAYVTLAEGPVMMTCLVECDPDAVAIGDAVEIAFRPSEGGPPVPCFRPVPAGR
ncbi:MAG: Zn-ribbon domain-containing OB-fold protein [Acetobacteraceae bacterium]